MRLTDKLWLGAAAGAAGFGFWGDKNQDLGDRIQSGAVLGLAAGAGSGLVWPGLRAGYGGSTFLGGKYLGSMRGRYAATRQAGVGSVNAGFHAFGTRGVFTGLGAVVGASVAGEGHRTQGAVIGGALGFGARSLVAASSMYGRIKPKTGGRLGFIASLSTLAFAAGAAFRNENNEAVASYNQAGGYDEYAPGAAPDSGIQERVKNIGATGEVVLGAHGLRHG